MSRRHSAKSSRRSCTGSLVVAGPLRGRSTAGQPSCFATPRRGRTYLILLGESHRKKKKRRELRLRGGGRMTTLATVFFFCLKNSGRSNSRSFRAAATTSLHGSAQTWSSPSQTSHRTPPHPPATLRLDSSRRPRSHASRLFHLSAVLQHPAGSVSGLTRLLETSTEVQIGGWGASAPRHM